MWHSRLKNILEYLHNISALEPTGFLNLITCSRLKIVSYPPPAGKYSIRVVGFEPTTSSTQNSHAKPLRYTLVALKVFPKLPSLVDIIKYSIQRFNCRSYSSRRFNSSRRLEARGPTAVEDCRYYSSRRLEVYL